MRILDLINTKVPAGFRDVLKNNQKKYSKLYDVCDVSRGYSFYQRMLLEKAIVIYLYDGLPESIPAHEIERLLMTLGQCVFVRDEKYGLAVLPCTFSGVGVYFDLPPVVTWATPLISGTARREKVAVGYNNSTHVGLAECIDRYSRLLSDLDATFSMTMYNQRLPYVAIAPNDEIAETYNTVLLANRLGYTSAVVADDMLKDMSSLPIAQPQSTKQLIDITTAREQIMRLFLSELGVQYGDYKRERQTTDEIHMNTQSLIVNSADMLAAREKMCADVNKVYGTNISVKINPAYNVRDYADDPKESEVEEDES